MKIVLWVVLGIVGLVIIVFGGFGLWVFTSSNSAINATYDVAITPFEIPTDSTSLAYGKHVATIRGCIGCHGADLGGGGEDLNMGPLGSYYPTNITSGQGGKTANYTTADWIRTIRHGVKPDGSTAIMMPSYEYYPIGDEDLAAMIGYLKSMPPVDRDNRPQEVGPVGRILIATGQMKVLTSAKFIDHDAPHPPAPERGVTVEYGEYLGTTCTGCHGENLAGGVSLGPNAPMSSNLTPAGLTEYDRDAFFTALRAGYKADGSQIDKIMPYSQFAEMTDDEIDALWLYLQSLPAVENEY